MRRQGLAPRGRQPQYRPVEVAGRLVRAAQAAVAGEDERLRLDGQVFVEDEHLTELPAQTAAQNGRV